MRHLKKANRSGNLLLKVITTCFITGGILLIFGYILNGASWQSRTTDHPWYQVVSFDE